MVSRYILCFLGIGLYLLIGGYAAGQPAGVSGSTTAVPATGTVGGAEAAKRFVTIDFDDVDIALFIKYISELTGRNFVIDSAVKGKVTIISPTKISEDEAYRVFESVLEVHGYTTVPAGAITKIVPAVEARSKSVETVFRDEEGAVTDKVVTQIIPLQYADPEELKKVFAPLVSKSSVVISYQPTSMLIVTDTLSNIRRLLQIIAEIDVADFSDEISIITLEHASATEVAKSLGAIFQDPSASSRRVRGAPPAAAADAQTVSTGESFIKIVPDERINALIIVAAPADTIRTRQVIELLDKEIPRGAGDIQVYYLQNAAAEDLAKVLTALPAKQDKIPTTGKAPIISKDVQIVADKATNSLVITAKRADYQVLEDVIKKLDIPRRMVYLEALIMEVNVTKDFRLGIDWVGGFTFNESQGGVAGTFGGNGNFGALGALTAPDAVVTSLPTGLSLGVFGESIKIGDAVFPNIGAIIDAFKTDADVHIISTPQLLTTDNEEAEIKVGQNVPYLTKQEQTSAVSGAVFNNFEYRDVGTTLKLTPQINQENVVRLVIFNEIIKLVGPVGELRPTTLKRSAQTTVIVKDNKTVVIGGIIGDDTNNSETKVPLLGDIPGLGWLFKSQGRRREKTNLYIFITPHIIRNPGEAAEVYEKKKGEVLDIGDEFINEFFEDGPSPTDAMLMSDLGFKYLQAGNYDLAKRYVEKALQADPDNPYALLNMGVILESEGKKAQAVKMYEQVIALDTAERAVDSTDPDQKGRALMEIARANLAKIKEQFGQ